MAGLFDFTFSECVPCGLCCPCMVFGRVAKAPEEGCDVPCSIIWTLASYVYGCGLVAMKVREKHPTLEQDKLTTCWQYTCCPLCAVLMDARTLGVKATM